MQRSVVGGAGLELGEALLDPAARRDAPDPRASVQPRIEVERGQLREPRQRARVPPTVSGVGRRGFESQAPPDPRYRALAHPARLGHRARRPTGGRSGRREQREHEHPLCVAGTDARRTTRARGIGETREERLREATAPLADGLGCDSERSADRLAGPSRRACQHDASAQRQRLGGAARPCPALQRRALGVREREGPAGGRTVRIAGEYAPRSRRGDGNLPAE